MRLKATKAMKAESIVFARLLPLSEDKLVG